MADKNKLQLARATQTGSENTRTISPTTSRANEQVKALMGVINKIRLSRGWSILPPQDAEITARAWAEILADVPAEAINDLYLLTVETRAKALGNGKEPPEPSAELMLSLWSGPNGLRHRLGDLRALGQLEAGDAGHACPDCFGSGLRYHTDRDTGRVIGVGGICDHRRLYG